MLYLKTLKLRAYDVGLFPCQVTVDVRWPWEHPFQGLATVKNMLKFIIEMVFDLTSV